MIIQVALILSVLFQFAAFVITISLIPKTRFSIAWISISIGFLLMAFRRLDDLFSIFRTPANSLPETVSSWIAVVISIAMLVSSFYIRKIFSVLNRVRKLRKENESRLLSAIISTEEKERKYFAKELHDGVGPILSSAKLNLSAMDKSELGNMNRKILEKTECVVDNAIVVTKEISNHLNPQVLERYGLEKAIKTFVRNTIVDNAIQIEINTNIGKTRFCYDLEVMIYRISCELINNTLKHASATKVTVSIAAYSNKLSYKYDDNGIGFDIRQINSTSMGITNIISRVKSLNGSIEIDTKPQKGVYITIEVPLCKSN
ncbi:MAG: sensor histidine kinase [Marinifilaceae bacterium]